MHASTDRLIGLHTVFEMSRRSRYRTYEKGDPSLKTYRSHCIPPSIHLLCVGQYNKSASPPLLSILGSESLCCLLLVNPIGDSSSKQQWVREREKTYASRLCLQHTMDNEQSQRTQTHTHERKKLLKSRLLLPACHTYVDCNYRYLLLLWCYKRTILLLNQRNKTIPPSFSHCCNNEHLYTSW